VWDSIADDVAVAQSSREERALDGDDEVDEGDDNVMEEELIPWGDPEAMDRGVAAEYDRLKEAARIP
jgi:hypothetical protein